MKISRARVLVSVSILIGGLSRPIDADARGWQQWVQQGANIVRRGVQIRNEAAGSSGSGYSGGGYHQAPPDAPTYQPAASGSPGSNYYNIDPSTMRVPTRHAEQTPPPEQPAYTPPTYQHSYTPRSAYHTGSDASSEQQQQNVHMPAYTQKKPLRARAVVKHVEKPEKSAVVVVHSPPEPKPQIMEKPDVLKPATTLDTSWILPTVDRVEAKLRLKS